jgi:hypothetical protein
MKHIKHHPLADKKQDLSKDMKKQDLVRPRKAKKIEAEDHLSDPKISKRYSKPSNRKLSAETHLSKDGTKGIKKVNESAPIAKVENEFIKTPEFISKRKELSRLVEDLETEFYDWCEENGHEGAEGNTDYDMTFNNIVNEAISRY